jgi:hypothetical protein
VFSDCFFDLLIVKIEHTTILLEGNMKSGHFVALFLALAFSLATVTSLYAADSWFVIKGKDEVCKVIEAKDKTPATIGGPFKTKKEAEAAKEKLCPKGAASTVDKIKQEAEKIKDKAKQEAEKIKNKAKQEGEKITEKAKQEAGKIKEKVKESAPSEKK